MEYVKSRWHEMSRGQRILLLLQPALFLLFLIVFLTFGQQPVVSYMGSALRCMRQGETTIYSGWLESRWPVQFTVSPGPTVEFQLSGKTRGVYTVAEDPTAIPETADMNPYGWEDFTGVEIKKDGQVWFRGAYRPGHTLGLFDEAGNNRSITIVAVTPSYEPDPDPGDILYFAWGPETSPRGYGLLMLLGLLVSAVCVFTLLFEDQLFRLSLSFRVQDPYRVEPSEWELLNRWLGWIVLTGTAVFAYAFGAGLIHIS